MSKENFYILLERYQSGQCTEQEKRLVEQWFASMNEEIPQRSLKEDHQLEERIWNAIKEQTEEEHPNTFRLYWKWIAAAVIFLVLGWGGLQIKPSKNNLGASQANTSRETTDFITHTNATKSTESHKLPDGSVLQLTPQSSISYNPLFNGTTREVFLEGKAFFKVTKNPERPFLVHTGEVVTKVLGTSFWVEGKGNHEAVEVSVVTGKVSVSQKENSASANGGNVKDGVILTPNQKVKYTTQTHSFETGLVVNPVPIVAQKVVEEELFIFQDEPISQVIKKLEKTYGIEIILENDNLTGCLFKGNITRQPLFNKLEILCTSINANYEVRGTRILISGKGCASDHLNPE